MSEREMDMDVERVVNSHSTEAELQISGGRSFHAARNNRRSRVLAETIYSFLEPLASLDFGQLAF